MKTRARLPALLLIVPPAWYMLGPAGGFYRLVSLAPGLSKFRAPIQGWFLVAFAFVCDIMTHVGAAQARRSRRTATAG